MPTNTSPKRRLSKAFTASIGSGVGNGVGVFELLVRQQCNNNTNNSNGNNNTKLLLEDLQALHSFLAHRSKRKCRTAGVGIGCKPGAKRAGFCPPSSTASTFTADCDEEKDEDDQSIAVEQHRWLGHLLGALERFRNGSHAQMSDDEEHSCASKSRRASHNQLVQNRKTLPPRASPDRNELIWPWNSGVRLQQQQQRQPNGRPSCTLPVATVAVASSPSASASASQYHVLANGHRAKSNGTKYFICMPLEWQILNGAF
ncbi:hypothetical protein ACLKA6_001398 [Drosophila palustris]